MKKRLLILIVTLTAVLQTAWAYDFGIGDLGYSITGPNTVEVSYCNYDAYFVTIPATVTDLETGITYSVTSIGIGAFSGRQLYSVTIPNSVTSIGCSAFQYCRGLTSVTIPNSVTSIDSIVFYECTSLTSITLPNSLDTIGAYAFCNTGLTSITIPENVRYIGSNAFGIDGYGNFQSFLTTVVWNAKNVSNFNSYYGAPFKDCSNISTVTFGDSVRVIPNYLFRGCSGLTSVTLPNSVDTIGREAFYNTGLTSITIPENVKYVGNKAFGANEYGNFQSFLTTVVWNAKNATIGTNVFPFSGCYNISTVTFGDSVRVIPDYLFSSCTGLTSVTLPNNVTTIGNGTFYNCTSLTSVTLPNNVTTIGNSTFYNCTSLTSVTLPNSVDTIGGEAFYNTGLTSITIPENVKYIGYNAFSPFEYGDLQYSLTTVVWNAKNATTIDGGDFSSYLPFSGCSNISTVTFGDSVKVIPNYIFNGCTGLTSVNIGNNVTTIGGSAFAGCTGLTSVTIGNSVTTIGGSAFAGCTGLTSVTIPNSVTTIGGSAFAGCSGLTSVTLPNSVDTIWHYAFQNTGLTSITIPENVRYIGSNAFGIYGYGNQSSFLTTVVWNAKNASITTDGWNYDSPFYGCSNISTVTFGDSVRVIPGNLFPSVSENITPNVYYGRDIENWINIKRINSGNYGYAMFGYYGNGKYNLYINNQLVTNLDIPNTVDTIQAGTFYGCNSIQSITIPTQIEFMESNAFCCWNLNSVTWNAINCNVESYYLGECGSGNINSLVLGDSVQVIPNYAFMVFGITNVNLPNSLTSIGENAFEGCINLASITIPSQVTTIGNGAFAECINLRSITMEPTVPPTIYTGTFYGVGTGVSVNVPCGTVEDYSSAAFWFNFSNIRQSSECFRTITVISLNTSQGTVLGGGTYEYGSTATIAAIPKSGYQFYQWNDGDVSNPRSLVVSSDSSFIATFSSITTGGGLVHDTLYVDRYIYDTIYTTVHDTVSNNIYDTVIITNYDTIINTVYDTIITTINDTVTITQYDTIINTVYDTVINTVYDTITVSETYYTLDVTSTNSAQGIGAGSGSYPEGCVVTIVGLPMEGYRFVSWNDGNTDNPRQITISENASYVANFGTVDIEEAPEVQNLSVYPNPTNGVVTISEYDVNKVEIYDGVGKKVREYTSQRVLDLSDLSSGEYILRITLPQGVAVRKVIKR